MLGFTRWKITLVCLTLFFGTLFALPNLFTEEQRASWPSWIPNRAVNLGLDLSGGSHLLLEVDSPAVLKIQLQNLDDSIRSELRRLKSAEGKPVGYRNFQYTDRAISFEVRDAKDIDLIVKRLKETAQFLEGSFAGLVDMEVESVGKGRVGVTLTQAAIASQIDKAVMQSLEIVRRRIDEMGTREPTIIRQGRDRILVQVPGLQDPKSLKTLLGKTARLEFKMVNLDVSQVDIQRRRVPPGTEVLPFLEDPESKIAVYKRVLVSGGELVDARQSYDQGQPVVSFRFDSSGGRKFADVTRENVGKPFAIILDEKVISAPRINGPILGGAGIIQGGFTAESANELAVLLRAGALPAPLNILEERTVGPDLGADSIQAGKIASLIGTIAVIIFMLVAYGRFGVYANIAVIFNVVLIVGAMSLTGATLTLPGIAGLVLTVGTCVDANVLIFERIREELRNGRSPISAVDTGYKEASRAIFDANITNLIGALLMFWFGSGPVKGFAVVLSIGIFTSVFTGVTFCRMLTAIWLKSAKPKKIRI